VRSLSLQLFFSPLSYDYVNTYSFADLAVIFQPGLISHPNHVLAPEEHHLSQKVLEFLIAQQDWFMLEVPPPPTPTQNSFRQQHQPGQGQQPGQSPMSPGSDDTDDVTVFPSSDDENNGGDGWKLVGQQRRRKVSRRRTTLDPMGIYPF
jgi:GTPase-activating protein SAC7